MSDDVFLGKLAGILEVNKDDLNDQYVLDADNWDSLVVVATIAAIDEQFNITVPTKELSEVVSVADLLALIRRSQQQA
jgi:acyl carrier protein